MLYPASSRSRKLRRRVALAWAVVLLWLVVEHSSVRLPTIEVEEERIPTINTRTANSSTIGASSSLPSVVIFYHLFIPREDDVIRTVQVKRAENIVHQQLRQLSDSLARISNLPPSPLHYTSVGDDFDETLMQDICGNLTHLLSCRRLTHLEQGFEEHTLAALHSHCQQHPSDRVIYLHSKGSYHSSKGQDRWRRHMTDAVASRDCIENAHAKNCDLCGLLFVPRPSPHFTGNMFNANCNHIRNLIPPMEFEAKMKLVLRKARQGIEEGKFLSNLFDLEQPWNSGTERYAMEHWHGSHPNVDRICDVSNHSTNKYWKSIRAADRTPDDWQFDWFPRRPQPGMPLEVANDESKRKREYFLLPGQLMKWYELYGEIPAITSWVWSWYPDGAFWKEKVQKHGQKAVEVVARRWSEQSMLQGQRV